MLSVLVYTKGLEYGKSRNKADKYGDTSFNFSTVYQEIKID